MRVGNEDAPAHLGFDDLAFALGSSARSEDSLIGQKKKAPHW